MEKQDDLLRFFSSVNTSIPLATGQITATSSPYMDLFRDPFFKKFVKNSPLMVVVYNFPEQKYEFVSESIFDSYGVRPEKFTTEHGAQAFINMIKPDSLELMHSEITPKMLECCMHYKEQVSDLRFSACLAVRTKHDEDGWMLLDTFILCADTDGFPVLSCTTAVDVSTIKKNVYSYYSASLCGENHTEILYSKNLTGNKKQVHFSKRELQIIRYLCAGNTTREIADLLCLSFDTIKKQRANILEKSGAKNTAELISFLP